MQKTENLIHGLSKEKWLRAFGETVSEAIGKDYFTDILFFDLYPDEKCETEKDYQALWDNVEDAFEEIFGYRRLGYLEEIDTI